MEPSAEELSPASPERSESDEGDQRDDRRAKDGAEDEAIEDDRNGDNAKKPCCSTKFSSFLLSHEKRVQKFQIWMSKKWMIPMMKHAAFYPYHYILITIIISLAVPAISFATGSISIETNSKITAVPQSSYPTLQDKWIGSSVFGADRITQFLIHDSGDNVLTWEAVNRTFDILDIIPHAGGYSELCSPDLSKCRYLSVAAIWANRSHFQSQTANVTDRDEVVREALSFKSNADGSAVPRSSLFGRTETDTDDDQSLLQAESIRLFFALSGDITSLGDYRKPFERNIGELAEELQIRWADEGSSLIVEMFNARVQDDELEAPITDDLPLFYAAVLTMSVFTALAFTRLQRDRTGRRCIQSSALLGFGAAITVILSLLTGYGFCTLTGYPITTLTQLLPFVLIGIGLDDSFVLMGALARISPDLSLETRLRKMARNAGPSIVVTTVTDSLAFTLGALFTSIPGIRWFCYYAVVCISIDFIYQTTFFIALLALDIRRQDAGRYDCLVCVRAKTQEEEQEDDDDDDDDKHHNAAQSEVLRSRSAPYHVETLQRRMMRSYAKLLLRPWVKAAVVVSFMLFFIGMAISASSAEVDFDLSDFLTDDSTTVAFFDADQRYFAEAGGGLAGFFYVRDLDQSNTDVQSQMADFIEDIVDLEYIDEFPPNFWVSDFNNFASTWPEKPFVDQLDAFLSVEPFQSLYSRNIWRDDDGSIIASRTPVTINIDQYDTPRQIDLLEAQREVTLKQPLNEDVSPGKERLFLFYHQFPIYFHYKIIPSELITALLVALVAVALVSMLFFPHPIGTVLSVVVVAMVNVELVGIIPLAGFTINTITVLLLIMAIGLVVDYCLHIIDAFLQCDPKYWSDRNERTEAALVEIGGSILLGGFSTFLGVVALAFASGRIFWTFFVMFVSMVTLGLAHGLVLLPVLLSLVGPTVTRAQVRMHSTVIFSLSTSLTKCLNTLGASEVQSPNEALPTNTHGEFEEDSSNQKDIGNALSTE